MCVQGRRMRTGTVTMLAIYERVTKLGCHILVRDKSSAVLVSEIEQLIAPGTSIITDALRSYCRLSDGCDHGCAHTFVTHEREFVNSKDTSVHTQNVEIRNRWTKEAIKSYKKNRPLNSYCAEYSNRLQQISIMTFQDYVMKPITGYSTKI